METLRIRGVLGYLGSYVLTDLPTRIYKNTTGMLNFKVKFDVIDARCNLEDIATYVLKPWCFM